MPGNCHAFLSSGWLLCNLWTTVQLALTRFEPDEELPFKNAPYEIAISRTAGSAPNAKQAIADDVVVELYSSHGD